MTTSSDQVCELCGNNSPIGSCTCLEAECKRCDGMGEWEEGPLPARHATQMEPEYDRVICPDCDGTGWIKCDRGGVYCRFASHDRKVPCYCDQAQERSLEP